ncbi:MAG TPA: hypothetical protein VFQ75_14790 [Candidatus Limnocylindrales bacterium]|nr:hypothetical protein [Candidatus Limnocylindrales bacterium]
MSPLLLLIVLVAALIGLIPVWRLRAAGWPRRWLVIAWVAYSGAVFLAVRAPVATRFLLPILVLAYVAPFVAGPERLTRVLRGPAEPPRPIIDVTPIPPVGLPGGDQRRDGDEDDIDGPGDGA